MKFENISKFKIIYESDKTQLYSGYDDEIQNQILIKVLNNNYPSQEQIINFTNEFDLLENVNSEYIRKVIQKTKIDGKVALIFEYVEGNNIKNDFLGQKIDVLRFTKLLKHIALGLAEVHKNNIIHRDFNFNNILYNPNDLSIKIIDFGISTKIKYLSHHMGNPEKLEGTLLYISPEQTGRMNRSVDYRTDMYSLGASAYEILAGKPLFEIEDPSELVYCHIAKHPDDLYSVFQKNYPFTQHIKENSIKFLSDIIMKLLAKNSEDRYQSGYGLAKDLEKLYDEIQNPGTQKLILGSSDFSGKISIKEKLYGREDQIKDLIDSYNWASMGNKKFYMIGGFSGVGKSALVHEVGKSTLLTRGIIIEGKFDQYQKTTPYYAWLQAFKEFVDILLQENSDTLEEWKSLIMNNLGPRAKILIDFIPGLKFILGSMPDLPDLGPVENNNRFIKSIIDFIKLLANPDHPLCLFLDDWQWSDSASLSLLKRISEQDEIKCIMVICAYRNNEVESNHPFSIVMEKIQSPDESYTSIILEPLSEENVHELIYDALGRREERLGSIIYVKTKGNSFFVNQILNSFYENSVISFNFEKQIWEIDYSAVEKIGFSDNVVELLSSKAKKMDETSLKILKFASCFRAIFSINELSELLKMDPMEVLLHLQTPLEDGFIYQIKKTQSEKIEFKFIHDRIQQAIYSLIDEKEKPGFHFDIGNYLLFQLHKSNPSELLYDITNHLNLAEPNFVLEEEFAMLLTLNVKSAHLAKDSSAYDQCSIYIEHSRRLVNENSWIYEYEAMCELYRVWAELEYLKSNLQESISIIHEGLEKITSAVDIGELYNLLVIEYTMLGQYSEAISHGIKALKILDVDLPLDNYDEALKIEMDNVDSGIAGRDIQEFLDFPDIQKEEIKIAIKIMNYLVPPAFMTNQPLFLVIASKMVNLSIKYGNSPDTSYGYAVYGIVLCQVRADYSMGFDFGKMAFELSLKYKDERKICLTTEVLVGHLNHWRRPLAESNNIAEVGFRAGVNSGEIQFAGFIYLYHVYNRFYEGINLKSYYYELNKYLEFTNSTKNQHASDVILGSQLTVSSLSGIMEDFEGIDEYEHFLNAVDRQSNLFICPYYVMKSQIHYMFDEFEIGIKFSEKAETRKADVPGVISVFENKFYYSLNILNFLSEDVEKDEEKIQKYLDIVKSNQKDLYYFSEISYENFNHKYLLIEALLADREKNFHKASSLFRDALDLAHGSGFVQNEAIVSEEAGKFYVKWGFEDIASIYFQRSLKCITSWGALKKKVYLEKKYSKYLNVNKNIASTVSVSHTITTSTIGSSVEKIDIASILKASQAISEEIDLGVLLRKLMKILLENAGADNGKVIIKKNNEWFIEASVGKDKLIHVLQSKNINIAEDLPKSLINYVIRSGESVVLDDAANKGQFNKDPYFVIEKIKSAMCIPLIKGSNMIGILYLENSLVKNTFTQERVEIINLLTSQIAISIENSRFYLMSSKFVPEGILKLLEKQSIVDVRLGDQVECEISILFSDIRSFTSISEKMNAAENFEFLNKYLSQVGPMIKKNYGVIDKYIGDAIMALFPGDVNNALDAGIQMLDEVYTLNKHKKENDPTIRIGIGINTGMVMMGVIGETDRYECTVISDAVNLASRIEGLTKMYNASLLISEYSFMNLKNISKYFFRVVDNVVVKGKNKPVKIYEILNGNSNRIIDLKLSTKEDLSNGIESYNRKDFNESIHYFNKVLQKDPIDSVAKNFINRASFFMNNDIPEDWDGSEKLNIK